MNKTPDLVAIDWYEFARIYFAYCQRSRISPGYGQLAAAMAAYEQSPIGHKAGWERYIGLAASLMQRCADEDNASLMRRKAEIERNGWLITHDVRGWTAVHANFRMPPYYTLRDLLETLPKGETEEIKHRIWA